ncbi:MAG: hypothetical protein EAZ89_10405 [Bacteroidetes bacterium]|nr:MAG: hypothetical protein EAZ89_10405 [Bacteroidota bacterium]
MDFWTLIWILLSVIVPIVLGVCSLRQRGIFDLRLPENTSPASQTKTLRLRPYLLMGLGGMMLTAYLLWLL